MYFAVRECNAYTPEASGLQLYVHALLNGYTPGFFFADPVPPPARVQMCSSLSLCIVRVAVFGLHQVTSFCSSGNRTSKQPLRIRTTSWFKHIAPKIRQPRMPHATATQMSHSWYPTSRHPCTAEEGDMASFLSKGLGLALPPKT